MNEGKNARDTQFQGFAKALFVEIASEMAKTTSPEAIQQFIARRAYDLVAHTVGYSLEYLHECGKEISGSMNSRITPSIPDITELPKKEGN